MSNKTVLIIDDEPNIRLLVSKMFKTTYNILEAKDGAEGIKTARANRPDLILLDIMMPNVDGYTACAAIKADANLKDIPVVMLTGLGFELNKELAKKVNANGYITKPFTFEIISSTICDLLGK